jgi:LPS sulfotransferase NodH
MPSKFKRAFFVCAVPRSGSYLLCELLQATAVAGYPTEYGVLQDEKTWREFLGFSDHRDYFFHFLNKLSVTGNSVFGAKMMFEQLTSFCLDLQRYSRICPGGPTEVLDLAFVEPRYIQLLRKDKARQAISLARALQTGSWNWSQSSQREPQYDPALIARAEQSLQAQEENWRGLLSSIDPSRKITLYYEDVLEDMSGSVHFILDWLGIDEPPRPFKRPSLQQQSDTISEQWLRQWRNESADY